MKITGLFANAKGTKTFAAGETIFEQGDAGDFMYGVVDGKVDLVIGGEVIDSCSTDDTFGEMAIIDRTPRMASAIAATDCTLAMIDRREFLFLVHETPMFALQVMSTMAERLRALR
jgi:CRP/FNR family transcriptional regulator, cyclic AMP receptor protein